MASKVVLAIDNSMDFLNLALATMAEEDGEVRLPAQAVLPSATGNSVAEIPRAFFHEGLRGSPRAFQLIEERHAKVDRLSSEVLPLKVSQLLADHHYSPSDLSLLILTLGPGSFTGIRVSLAFSKGLAAALRVPLVGVATLDALAAPFAFLEGYYLAPLIDAKKGEVFFSLYRVLNGAIVRVDGFRSLKPHELEERIKTPCLCFGTGVRLCSDAIHPMEGVSSVRNGFYRISGETLLRVGLARFESGEHEEARLIYGRKSEAEIKFNVTLL
jgi:tRNA threonylcarbamoyladenosine biosynthesis protein TsaB